MHACTIIVSSILSSTPQPSPHATCSLRQGPVVADVPREPSYNTHGTANTAAVHEPEPRQRECSVHCPSHSHTRTPPALLSGLFWDTEERRHHRCQTVARLKFPTYQDALVQREGCWQSTTESHHTASDRAVQTAFIDSKPRNPPDTMNATTKIVLENTSSWRLFVFW